MMRPPAPPTWDSDRRFQELVELAPDGILVHDGHRIVLANAAAIRLAGATHRDQVVGLPVDTFLDPPYLKALETDITLATDVAKAAPPVLDVMHRLDGSDVDVEVRAVAFVDHGRPSAHLILRDVTDRLAAEQKARSMEQQMQRAQRMEVVGALAGGMAHEVNNMMSIVLGFSEFLASDVALPEHCLGDIREIMKAAERAATVTKQLLAFSRRSVHMPQAVVLDTVVRELAPVARRLLGETRQVVVSTQAPHPVWVDPAQLQQVLLNLVLNARDAMPAGGTLTITTVPADVAADTIIAADGNPVPAGAYALLAISDTGTGMSAVTAARIFDPFFTTKPLGQGTGLGLAAAQGIVAQSSGFITVQSVLGEGTTFTIYLRTDVANGRTSRTGTFPNNFRRPDAVDHTPARVGSASAGATVLVVDDEPSVRQVAVRVLESNGFHPIPATDGVHALELIERFGPPDLVLTDMMMPRMGGADLALRIKKQWPKVLLMFMSGYSPAELYGQGAVGFEGEMLQKPFTSAALIRSVLGLLAKRDAAINAR